MSKLPIIGFLTKNENTFLTLIIKYLLLLRRKREISDTKKIEEKNHVEVYLL
jgi:hypothetical protein